MTEKIRKTKRRDESRKSMIVNEKITKEQKAVTHWMRKNVPYKKTKFLHSHVVQYFIASKAIDCLLNDSPWSKKSESSKDESEVSYHLTFENRQHVVSYMDDLLRHKMFHRARKIPVMDKSGQRKKKSTSDGDAAPGGEKKKRKIRLDMHLEQVFVDGSDAYVWLYDPIPWYYWLAGSVIVLGIIAMCLFPLWPSFMRLGVHYMSLAAAGFLLFIVGLCLLKYVVFALFWLLSGGYLRLWIFPRLTEDVGFFESFWPIYDYTYTGKSLKLRRRKDKVSDDEECESGDEKECSSESNCDKSESLLDKEFEVIGTEDKSESTSKEEPSDLETNDKLE